MFLCVETHSPSSFASPATTLLAPNKRALLPPYYPRTTTPEAAVLVECLRFRVHPNSWARVTTSDPWSSQEKCFYQSSKTSRSSEPVVFNNRLTDDVRNKIYSLRDYDKFQNMYINTCFRRVEVSDYRQSDSIFFSAILFHCIYSIIIINNQWVYYLSGITRFTKPLWIDLLDSDFNFYSWTVQKHEMKFGKCSHPNSAMNICR